MPFKITILFLFFALNLFCQIDIFKISNTSFAINLEKSGKPSLYKNFKINGYAPLIIRKPRHYKNELVVFPKNIRKAKDTAFAEISIKSIVYKNIVEKYYFLVLNYKTKTPIVYISKEGVIDFSNNKIIIDKTIKKHILEIATKKGKTEFIIDYSQALSTNLGFSEMVDSTDLIDLNYSIPIWDNSIKYGVYQSEKDTLCIGLYDANHNGIFNEKNIDRLMITDLNYAPYFEIFETSSSSLISDSLFLKLNTGFLKTLYISPSGNLLYVDKVAFWNDNHLKLLGKIPDSNFLCSDSISYTLNSKSTIGKYFFVYIWITRCTSCLQDLSNIDNIMSRYKNKLASVCLLDKSNFLELNKTINNLKLKSPQGLTNKNLNNELHLNGYPFGILFDVNGNLIKKIGKTQELIDFLETHDK